MHIAVSGDSQQCKNCSYRLFFNNLYSKMYHLYTKIYFGESLNVLHGYDVTNNDNNSY